MLDNANTGFQLLRWFYNRFFQPTFLHCSPKIKLSFFSMGSKQKQYFQAPCFDAVTNTI